MKIEAYFILRSDLKFDGVFVLGALHIYNVRELRKERVNLGAGVFDIYSDIESKIKHYKRINVFWTTLRGIYFLLGLSNILGNFNMVNIIMGLPLVLFGLIFLRLGSPIRKKIKNLKQEKMIRE